MTQEPSADILPNDLSLKGVAAFAQEMLPPKISWNLALAILIGGSVCALLMSQAPLLGHDWIVYFAPQVIAYQYAPWITLILTPLTVLPPRVGLAIVHGFTIAIPPVYAYYLARQQFPDDYKPGILAVVFTLITPVPWMLTWVGQIEVMALIGVISLPLGIVLAFAKPHMAPWAALGSRRDIAWLVIFLSATLLIWWMWPLALADATLTYRIGRGTSTHPLAMGWSNTHIVVALIGAVLLLFTNRDRWRLIAAGCLISPFLMPYHFYLLLPALGLTQGYAQIGLWLAFLLPLVVTASSTTLLKFVTLLLPLTVWALLAPSVHPRDIWNDQETILRRLIRTTSYLFSWFKKGSAE